MTGILVGFIVKRGLCIQCESLPFCEPTAGPVAINLRNIGGNAAVGIVSANLSHRYSFKKSRTKESYNDNCSYLDLRSTF